MSDKNYYESYNLTHDNSRILFMTDKFVNRFAQLWEQIFKNCFQYRFPNEFFFLGKLLTICRNCRSHDCQVITSGQSYIVLDTLVCTKMGRHGYENDSYGDVEKINFWRHLVAEIKNSNFTFYRFQINRK